ncbi:MAG: enolase C-terminal domain-like protein, partial [Myxococcota bacterium]
MATPNLLMVEAIETPFHDALVTGRPRVEAGFVPAPDAPGLGITLNDDVAAAHVYTGNRLHLEMQ